MSSVRKVLLLVAVAVAATGMTAATASAQETEVEVFDEATGTACNPCTVHAEGESRIITLPSGVVLSGCEDEIDVRLYHDGTGEIEWQGTSAFSPGCNTTNCVVNSPHLRLRNMGELGTGQAHAYVKFCLRAGSTEATCEAEITSQTQADHEYGLTLDAICLGSRRFEGSWEPESTDPQDDEIEIEHSSE